MKKKKERKNETGLLRVFTVRTADLRLLYVREESEHGEIRSLLLLQSGEADALGTSAYCFLRLREEKKKAER